MHFVNVYLELVKAVSESQKLISVLSYSLIGLECVLNWIRMCTWTGAGLISTFPGT